MRKVRCYECGKNYDFDIDDFCPKCGAFNQPGKSSKIGGDGAVVRVDGLNEQGHKGSFVHRELHAEDRVRRAVGLEQRRKNTPTIQQPRQQDRWRKGKKQYGASRLVAIVLFLIVIQLLSVIVETFF